ncbi:MAG TPA: DUF6504 family protein, partial [Stellaceae bacterium]|nr:DUF6504 family protein [Stellaceae bacterium]
ADPADLALAIRRLTGDLVPRLAREGMGARRLDLALHRVDGRVERLVLGTARPSRDPHHLARLFEERLEAVDPGLGVEDMILSAFAVEPLGPEQIALDQRGSGDAAGGVGALLDRLGNRLGFAALYRLEPRESHIPERASVGVPVDRSGTARSGELRDKPPRPIRLFEPPEPIEASFLLPDDPPFHFIWRRRRYRVMRADGPERIAAEWWREARGAGESRDYYRVEDADGRRFWVFRAEPPDGRPCGPSREEARARPRWFLHGVFA